MMGWTKWMAALLVVTMVGVADAKATKTSKLKKKSDVSGTIATVSKGTLTIHATGDKKSGKGKKGAGKDIKVKVNGKTTVSINGNPGKVGSLHAGQKVKISESGGIATEVKATDGKAGKGKKTKKKK